jgi:hypothetical protein
MTWLEDKTDFSENASVYFEKSQALLGAPT